MTTRFFTVLQSRNAYRFPEKGDPECNAGIPRNYEIFNPLDFLAEVTQHIPNKGEHQIRYYGWYSNKRRGMNRNGKMSHSETSGSFGPDEYWEKLEDDTASRKKSKMTWAALIIFYGDLLNSVLFKLTK